jgi:cytochrome c oxidase cbb3-type subunit 3
MMRRPGGFSVASVLLAVSMSFGAFGCDDTAPDLAEWTVADHDQPEPPKRRSAAVPAVRTHAPPSPRNQVVDVTWSKQCASCHGKKGRGDGPSSVMVKARDLTPLAWQASVTDEQLVKIIKEGKGKMPAFNLPDSVVQGLVAHVRSLAEEPREKEHGEEGPLPDERPTQPAGATESPAGAPAASAPPSAAAPAAPADGR